MRECIIASQKPRKDGYVVVHVRDYQKEWDYAHRIAYVNAKGEIPQGMTIDHLCYIKNCINPDHLEAVPLSTNLKRRRPFLKRNAAGHSHADMPKRFGKIRCNICDRIYKARHNSLLKGAI